jgi:hypothetical protein
MVLILIRDHLKLHLFLEFELIQVLVLRGLSDELLHVVMAAPHLILHVIGIIWELLVDILVICVNQ